MNAFIVTYLGEELVGARSITLPADYNGDPYGDQVPYVLGSNQGIVLEGDPLWENCLVLDQERLFGR